MDTPSFFAQNPRLRLQCRWLGLTLAGLLILQRPASLAASGMRVVSDFEGGSVRVLRVEADAGVVEFMPGGDPTRGWPCWWFFKLEGAQPGGKITLRLRGSDATVSEPGRTLSKPLAAAWAMPAQAAYSLNGRDWKQTEKGSRDGEWMTYSVSTEDGGVWVAWGPPYTLRMATEFVRNAAASGRGGEARELCRSREGRPVPLLRLSEGARPSSNRYGVWIQARQHAWESGSSWVGQGLAEWLLSDAPEAGWVRQHAELYLVPVMDADNVATGNGGKDAVPHDHNRDWSDAPHWQETRAAQTLVKRLVEEGRMDVFLDLHNPAPGDPTFFYLLDRQMIPERAQLLRDRFVELGYSHISKGLPFIPMSNRPKFTGPDYHPLWKNISANWVAMNANPQTVSVCLETIWNYSNSNTEGYRAVGSRLGLALHDFLAEQPRRQ